MKKILASLQKIFSSIPAEWQSRLFHFSIIILSVMIFGFVLHSLLQDTELPEAMTPPIPIDYPQEYDPANYTNEALEQTMQDIEQWLWDNYRITNYNYVLKREVDLYWNRRMSKDERLVIVDIWDDTIYGLLFDEWVPKFPYEDFPVPLEFEFHRRAAAGTADSP